MDQREILSKVDHTLLKPEAAWEEIRALCDEAVKWGTASVCIPPCYVGQAAEYLGGRLPVCTVVGFPNGYSTTQAKLFETREALAAGAQEIDMVINIGRAKGGDWDYVYRDIKAVVSAAGDAKVKVILETCLLTDEEKVEACKAAVRAGAAFVKTSTGFSTGGATVEDIKLMRAAVGPEMGVKASGGIRDKAAALAMLEAGATRIGASATGAIVAD